MSASRGQAGETGHAACGARCRGWPGRTWAGWWQGERPGTSLALHLAAVAAAAG